jgi:preprotein translocase subunit SecF
MISFLKLKKYSYSLSIFLTLFLFALAYKKYCERGSVFSYGVEFTGGTQIKFILNKSYLASDIHTMLKNVKLEGFVLRQFSDKDFLLRLKGDELASKSKDDIEDYLENLFKNKDSDIEVSISAIDHVGSGFGAELKYRVFIAIAIALLCMFMYVWFRFKTMAFAFANLISLAHDVLIILLFALMLDYEFSYDIVGAVLFILGYSINDTMVIFSRIRENIEYYKKDSLDFIIDRSINETLRRTILTSLFTTLVVIPLVLCGGESLKIMSSSLLIGIVFGTYSSLFIAAPLVYSLKTRFNW